MTLLTDLFPPTDLQAEIDAGYVTRKQHPTLPLSILTYGRSCQYENHWTPVTTRCRGLIVDDTDGRIVAHCMPKFFAASMHGNYDFAPPLPDEPFQVFDKVDGSLGVVFHYADAWHVASKGSFTSEQAQWAQAWLDKAEPDRLLEPGTTYLAEIVYPENRIVVNNGDERTLVLLAVYDNSNGWEHPVGSYEDEWRALGGRVVRSWRRLPLQELMRLAEENTKLDGTTATGTDAEGWVVRFISGVRVKIKYAEYARLHRTLTGTNARDIWRCLGADLFGTGLAPKSLGQALGCSVKEAEQLGALKGRALAAILEQVPDEFDAWARGIEADLHTQFAAYRERIASQFDALRNVPGGRPGFAKAAQGIEDRTVRAAMFATLDDKPVDTLIWKAIRPEASDPFRNDEEG